MFKRIVASLILVFVLMSLALPIQLQKKDDVVEELCTISQCDQAAGVHITVIPQKKIKKTTGNELRKQEFELLCRTVYCEAGNQDIKTQTMVALTILNRVKSDKFPNTVKGVVYQKNAYAVSQWKNFESYKWTEQVEKAVKQALKSNKYPKDMYYFRTKHYHKFGRPYMKSDDLWFSTQN